MTDRVAQLAGKVALVTGASSGLGAHFAGVLAQAGAAVILAARRTDRLSKLQRAIEAEGGRARALRLDVTEPASISNAVEAAANAFGAIDILVNNSGVTLTKSLVGVTPEEYDCVMDTNTKGAFFVATEVAKTMIARFGRDPGAEGRIVNLASVGGLKVVRGIGVYCTSKAALIHFTKAMALEWGRYGINVNALCPGYIRTELNDAYFATPAGAKQVETLPRKRLGTLADLDGILLHLVSPQARLINGSVIAVDDGYSLT